MSDRAAGVFESPGRCFHVGRQPMRITPADFQRKSLYAHAFLAAVPLHDVWAIHLKGGEGRSLRDFQSLLLIQNAEGINPVVKVLFALRWWLGRVFGWDDEKHQAISTPYIQRLPEVDRARSLTQPGTQRGAFRVVYEFEDEALAEIINATVHAFALTALEPAAGGYVLYLAIYVRKVSWLTPFYMALIDPFRRWIVYPALVRHVERTWAAM